MTNGYDFVIVGSDYEIKVDSMGDTPDEAFEWALYKLINSTPKLDLFEQDLEYRVEAIYENVLGE